MKHFLTSAVIFVLSLANASAVSAQTEITLIAPNTARGALNRLIPGFESKTGYKVKMTFGTGQSTRQQIASGDAFDFAEVQTPIENVVTSGNVVASSQTALATVGVGVAVKKGAPKPDISTPDAVKRMLLAAKSITYPDPATGASAGASFDAMTMKLSISEQLKPKLKLTAMGKDAMEMTAKGDAEFGFTLSNEMDNPGIDIVGELPAAICPPPTMLGFISAHAKNPAAARALLDYLSSPEAAEAYKASRMRPAH